MGNTSRVVPATIAETERRSRRFPIEDMHILIQGHPDSEARNLGCAARARASPRIHVIAGALVCCLSGCSSAPSRNILGSYFPSWMICALLGLCATVAVRGLLIKVGIDKELPAPIVVYLAFAVAFSLGMWLLWLA